MSRTKRKVQLPNREELEKHYEPREIDVLDELLRTASQIKNDADRAKFGRDMLHRLWPEELLFLSKTFWIRTKSGAPTLLEPNYAQLRFYNEVVVKCREEGRPIRAIILKARQLGFSTFIQALHYTIVSRAPHRNSLVVSYDDPSTKSLLSKAQFGHGRMWFPIGTDTARREMIEFEEPHGSTFQALTAGGDNVGRGYTYHRVHCSEIPQWPGDKVGVLAGLGEAIPKTPESTWFWESTARGMTDPFYEGWQDAVKGLNEYIPFFCAWFEDPTYSMPFRDGNQRRGFQQRIAGTKDELYMRSYDLTLEQMNWRASKLAEPNMNEKTFRQEYPASADEAFLTSGSPVFDADVVHSMSLRSTDPVFVGNIVLESRQ